MRDAASIAIDVRMHCSSGIGTYITELLPRIVHARPDWRFSLLGPPAELAAYDWAAGKNVRICPCDAPIYSVSEQLQLVRRTPRHVDLFWAPHYNIPLGVRTKLLVTVHDVFHLAMPSYIRHRYKQAYARGMFAAIRRRADTILCVSHFTQREFLRLVGERQPAPQTIHPGVDESWFDVPEADSPHDKPFLLFVGNIKPHKNLAALLQAFGFIMADVPHDLIIVGKQEGFITADSAAVEMAQTFRNRVHFTGVISRSSLQQYFTHATALVFPSLYEGFGLPPLEAMACGCPVIASMVAAIPEVCEDGVLYCDPRNPRDIAEKIMSLIGDPALRANLQKRGRVRAALFRGWGRCAEQTLDAIEELLGA